MAQGGDDQADVFSWRPQGYGAPPTPASGIGAAPFTPVEDEHGRSQRGPDEGDGQPWTPNPFQERTIRRLQEANVALEAEIQRLTQIIAALREEVRALRSGTRPRS